MRSPPVKDNNDAIDDCDDIFGPPRTYPTGYSPPKSRPTMISAKYKQKEERRKVLKISLIKLKKIEDPESSLCRSVLINNTMRRLQKETRDEKIQKQRFNYPRCYDNYLNIKTEFLKNEKPFEDDHNQNFTSATTEHSNKIVEVMLENDFDAKLEEEIKTLNEKNIEIMEQMLGNAVEGKECKKEEVANCRMSSRKRSFDELDDCDVQDVLSQFYMPPTPRMLTGIDEDDDVNVVDEEPPCKKLKETQQMEAIITHIEPDTRPTDLSTNATPTNARYSPEIAQNTLTGAQSDFVSAPSDYANAQSDYHNAQSDYVSAPSEYVSAPSDVNSAYSCGHASMFTELQSNVYHSLITSLET